MRCVHVLRAGKSAEGCHPKHRTAVIVVLGIYLVCVFFLFDERVGGLDIRFRFIFLSLIYYCTPVLDTLSPDDFRMLP